MQYPDAPAQDIHDDLHGTQVADPYRWLEDATSEQTQAWSAAQQELYTQQASTWKTREHFAGRVGELMGGGFEGVPIWRGQTRFFMRRTGEQEHAVLYVHDDQGERALLDPMALDPTGLTTVDSWVPCRQGRYLAYQVSEGGREESVLRVLDVASGDIVDGPIDRARYSPVAWVPDSSGYYYVRRLDPAGLPENEQQYHRRVWWHQLGTDPATDVEIFGAECDHRSYYGVGVSRDGRWLTISATTGTSPANDIWIADIGEGSAPAGTGPQHPAMVEVMVGVDARTDIGVGRDGRLYVATDYQAPRGRLAVTDPTRPQPEHWRDLLPEDPEAVLEDFAILDGPELGEAGHADGLLMAAWTRHAVSEITVHQLSDGTPLEGDRGRVEAGLGSIGGLITRPEGGYEAWFSYTDFVSPPQIRRYDGRTGEVSVYATPPGAVQVPPGVQTRQVTFTSTDGTPVRMFVISRDPAAETSQAPVSPNGPRPTILNGYGGFAISMTPGFSASILAWVEAGGVYAIACLRGGSEEGEEWHRDGMLGNKQNVYEDFHSAAQWLIGNNWTTPDQLVIYGGSNGGLLVGAAMTQWPQTFAGVICSAPLLDMVRYELFGLGATWNTEYGSASVPEEFAWLYAYSPYHRVRQGVAYPATLFTVFEGDTRVDPLHARKLCAALQAATSSPRPVLYRCEADVGHGARAVSRSVLLSGDVLGFAAYTTGLHI